MMFADTAAPLGDFLPIVLRVMTQTPQCEFCRA
jgi:hypothetical protein